MAVGGWRARTKGNLGKDPTGRGVNDLDNPHRLSGIVFGGNTHAVHHPITPGPCYEGLESWILSHILTLQRNETCMTENGSNLDNETLVCSDSEAQEAVQRSGFFHSGFLVEGEGPGEERLALIV